MRVYHRIFLVILFFICLIFSYRVGAAQNLDNFPAKQDPATNLSTEREKLEIYSKLRDRRCTTMTLDKCNCPEAREMKAYIDALLETGTSKEEVFYKVAKKFSLNTILDKQVKAQIQERLIKEAGKDRPQIIVEPNSFDFGQVSKKQGKIQKIFRIHNKGTAKLIITNIKVSCSCTTASLIIGQNKSPYFGTQGAPSGWQAIIEPAKSADLEVIVDLEHPSVSIGKLIRDINITSNDPLYPEVTVKIEAGVKD